VHISPGVSEYYTDSTPTIADNRFHYEITLVEPLVRGNTALLEALLAMNSRRRFLEALGAGGMGLALNSFGLGSWLKVANAAHDPSHTAPGCGIWGDLEGSVGPWNCGNHQGYKILEIYLRAGASQWESLWLPGNASAPNFSDFDLGAPNTAPFPSGNSANSADTLDLSQVSWSDHTSDVPCEPPDIPPSSTDAMLFAAQTSPGGGNIYWGAPTRPIFNRNDIFSRCRMITQYHDLLPHEAAIPFALTGSRLGNPRLAGTGAAVQRRDRALNPDQLLPVSYVLHNGSPFDINFAAATGMHPGAARPLVIQLGDSNSFFENLGRTGITPESDDLLLALRHEYRDRLRFRGAGKTVRSAGFDGYWTAAELLESAPTLQTLFENEILVVDSNVARCAEVTGLSSGLFRGIKTQLHAAASLLSTGPAKYVCTIDRGIAGSYDTHQINHMETICSNMYNVTHHLADIIHHPINNPTGQIDLDETLVVIHTEFGREPWIENGRGRDHWPYGFVTTLIGGPIPTGGPSIGGGIDSGDGMTHTDFRYTPADVRGALLEVAGIDPFADGNFNVASFSEALRSNPVTVSEPEIRNRLRSRVLGL